MGGGDHAVLGLDGGALGVQRLGGHERKRKKNRLRKGWTVKKHGEEMHGPASEGKPARFRD